MRRRVTDPLQRRQLQLVSESRTAQRANSAATSSQTDAATLLQWNSATEGTIREDHHRPPT
jgi:hypothetical protein